jgi:hypothetical protein
MIITNGLLFVSFLNKLHVSGHTFLLTVPKVPHQAAIEHPPARIILYIVSLDGRSFDKFRQSSSSYTELPLTKVASYFLS